MRFVLPAILTTLCLAVLPGYGQQPRSTTPPASGDPLKQAREKIDPSRAAKAAEGVADKLPGNLSKAAKSAMESPEAKQQAIDALKSAAGNLLPEAQKLMKRGDAAAATDAPGTASAADAPPAEAGPKPMPLQPLIEPAAAIRSTATVTIDSDDAVFDLKAGIFIYRGHVHARHPQFYIECEELEVHMVMDDPDAPPASAEKNGAKPKARAGAEPKKDDPILAKPGEKPKENAIKMAIARGPMVTIEKVSEQGEVQQAKCRRALYEASTGEITMSDYPQVLRGNVLQAATSPSTTMVFSQKGKLTTNGPSKTDILSRSETEGELPGGLTPKPRAQ